MGLLREVRRGIPTRDGVNGKKCRQRENGQSKRPVRSVSHLKQDLRSLHVSQKRKAHCHNKTKPECAEQFGGSSDVVDDRSDFNANDIGDKANDDGDSSEYLFVMVSWRDPKIGAKH